MTRAFVAAWGLVSLVAFGLVLVGCSASSIQPSFAAADYGQNPAGYTPGGGHPWRVTP